MAAKMIGKKLANRYEIIELIGSGGMATVYKGKCELLKRYVAVKVLHENLKDDPEVVRSFNKEAQSAASLTDNNIVSVFDVGEEDGMNYMVMEFVDGLTLKKYIQENGAVDWREACGFVMQICHALSVAHAQGIVHRDIKPQNILMTKDGVLKVTDFGIAKAAVSETISVGTNSAMGSVHYISPEQARGGYTDERSDIYSLGVLFYELVTGQVPYDGASAVSVALMHIEKDIPVAKAVNPELPIEVSNIIKKAMSKEQFARYQSALDFMSDIEAFLNGEPMPVLGSENGIEENMEQTKLNLNIDRLGEDYEDYDEYQDDPEYDSEKAYEEEPERVKKKKTKKIKTPEQKNADRLATILAFLTIIFIVALSCGGYILYNNMSDNVIVPFLYEATIDEATQLVNEKGLVIGEVEYAQSDSVMKDRIISQNPGAREQVKKGSVVNVVVSLGDTGGTIEVPYVVNIDPTEAIEKILDAGLSYDVKEENSAAVAAGRVARQLPEAGTKLNENDTVIIYTSLGPKVQVNVPNLSECTQEKAGAMLAELGLQIGTVSYKASDKPRNTVVSQIPAANSKVDEGSFVSIILSSGMGGESGVVSSPGTGSSNAGSQGDNTATGADNIIKTISFTVPGEEGTVHVKVLVNGNTAVDEEHACGEEIKFEIPSNQVAEVVLYLDGKEASRQTFND